MSLQPMVQLDPRTVRELERALAQLPRNLQRRAGLPALRKGVKLFLEEAQRQCPIGPGVDLFGRPTESGDLRASLRIKVKSTNYKSIELQVLTDKFYATWVEKGHRIAIPHQIPKQLVSDWKSKKRKRRPGRTFRRTLLDRSTTPNPFMTRTFEALAERVQREVAQELGRRLGTALK